MLITVNSIHSDPAHLPLGVPFRAGGVSQRMALALSANIGNLPAPSGLQVLGLSGYPVTVAVTQQTLFSRGRACRLDLAWAISRPGIIYRRQVTAKSSSSTPAFVDGGRLDHLARDRISRRVADDVGRSSLGIPVVDGDVRQADMVTVKLWSSGSSFQR